MDKSAARRRMPDFAGVALVDILANGVAMLIIVIVVSIAARIDRDARHAEQADEVAAVMSHQFSTSLVLNSLAASPPAVLHDYAASPIDQILDPQVLPIIELHTKFVREFYSGAIWPRRELLQEFNGMTDWLASLNPQQKQRLRMDVYDVGQFYVTMSTLREHDITVRHWHFLRGPLALGDAARCPPGVAAKDCLSSGSEAPDLPTLSRGTRDSGDLGDDWPRFDIGDGDGAGGGNTPGRLPGGVVPGAVGGAGDGFGSAGGQGGQAGNSGNSGGNSGNSAGSGRGGGLRGSGFGSQGTGSAAELGSFPNADPSAGGAGGAGGAPGGAEARDGAPGQGAGRPGVVNFRIAMPDFVQRAAGAGAGAIPTLETIFGVMFHYLGELQDALDRGDSPSQQVADFSALLQRAFSAPPPLTAAERLAAQNLAIDFALRDLVDAVESPRALLVRPAQHGAAHAFVALTPNRVLESVRVHPGGPIIAVSSTAPTSPAAGNVDIDIDGNIDNNIDNDASAAETKTATTPPEHARVSLALNAYPGIWQGLDLRLTPGSALLTPPQARAPHQLRWRTAAHISKDLDDFIVGFVLADFDADGNLRAQADANRLQINGRALFSVYPKALFGTRGWLVTLYAALVLGLLLLVLSRRWLTPKVRPRTRPQPRPDLAPTSPQPRPNLAR